MKKGCMVGISCPEDVNIYEENVKDDRFIAFSSSVEGNNVLRLCGVHIADRLVSRIFDEPTKKCP